MDSLPIIAFLSVLGASLYFVFRPKNEEIIEVVSSEYIDGFSFNSALEFKQENGNKMTNKEIRNKAWNLFIPHVKQREGLRLDVYLDSLGKETIGYGHLVLPSDGLRLGDIITQAKADEFLAKDSAAAFALAETHAKELDLYNVNMLVALASANFQLGDFKKKFGNTFNRIKRRNFSGAIAALKQSLWNTQTPVRVTDFIAALEAEKINYEGGQS